MADGAAAALAAMADDGRALVDAETLRGLRGAERPAMPDASQPAPTLVGHTSDRVNPEISAAVPEGMTLELFQDAALRQDDAITLPNRVSDDAAAADATPVGFVAAPDSAPGGSSAAVAAAPRGSSTLPAAVEQAVVPAAPVAAAEATAAADAAAITAPPAPDPAPPQPVAPALVPVADPARLDARNASTLEDQPVPLDIAASLADLDGAGGETLAIVIAGLPPGSVLSAGTQQADGSWVLTPDQLAGLLLTPPRDWSGDATLSIRAIVTGQTGDQVETATTLNLHVEAVADAPAVAASGGGAEDTAIPLSLDVRATDIDGSESITSVRISGVPDGASLSAGTRGADGVWTLDPADLAGVTLTPPLHFSGSIGLALTAVSTEPNASTAASAIAFTVGVTAVADAPLATAQDSSGNEDSWIPLNGLSAALVDRDGSEALTVAIAGVPDGAALSAGARQPDGSWQVPVSALATLEIRPPGNFSGTIDLMLGATASETGAGVPDAMTQVPFQVTVLPVVDAATIAGSASGREDSWITLHTSFATPDTDGSEQWAPTSLVSLVPAGAILSEGTQVSPGTWQVDTARLAAGGVSIRPPADSDGDFTLSVTTTLTDSSGVSASRDFTGSIPVAVAAIADAPPTTAADATGAEDSWIALQNLSASLADRDGSETLAVSILGVPAGASLSAGTLQPDGSWQVAASALATLAIRPPENFAGQIALTLRAASTEADPAAPVPVAATEVPFTVTVTPAVDGAAISGHALGREDSWITLTGSLGTPADGSERWADTLTISGVPAGAVLNGGTDLGGGTWQVSRDEFLAGHVALRPPADSDADFTLTLAGTVIDEQGGMSATRAISAPLPVTVVAVADLPSLSAVNVAGREDTPVPLSIASSLSDIDGSEALRVVITGLPTGASLSAGARQPDGSWVVPSAALPTLSLTPPQNFSGIIPLSVTATSTEARDASSATITAPFTVTIAPLADAGSITGSGRGAEDSWIPITARFSTSDTDGSEHWGATTLVSGVPAGATLSQGTQTAPGVWQVSTTELAAGHISIRPPADSDADISLGFATVLTDSGAGATDSRTITGSASVVVTAVADAPGVHAADATGREDSWIPLPGLGGALADTDGSETLSFRITGLPSGARLSAGTRGTDGAWTLTPAQLATVRMRPPSNFSGTLDLTLTSVATETRDGNPTATTSAPFRVSIDPVVDAGTITGSARGREDSWIVVRPTFRTADSDGSETWSATTTITGVPSGATLSQGTQIAPGVWEVSTTALRGGGVSLRPPADSDADFTLRMSATLTDSGNGNTDTRTVTGTVPVTVIAVADAPAIAAAAARGNEDSWIPLDLSAALTDRDGSETLSVTISGLPAGALLSAGTALGNGLWRVDAAALPGLSIQPPRDYSGSFRLLLSATATDHDSSTATSTAAFTVTVDAVADVPTLRVSPAVGNEDSAIALTLSARAVDIDGSETLAFYRIADVPSGAVLRTSAGVLSAEADGSYLVPANRAGSLRITPPHDSDADFTLRVSAIAREPNGSTAESAPEALPVRVLAIADTPLGLSGGGRGSEDTPVPLNIAARLSDTDGSEALYYIVSGVPDGMSLNTGTYAGPGRWSLSASEAASAALVTPRDWSGTVNLTLTAVAQEQDGGSAATTSIPIALAVAPVIDVPAIVGPGGTRWSAAAGAEDSWIALNLDPGLRDSDGSERVIGSVAISGLPGGAVLAYRDGTVLVPSAGSFAIPVARMGEVVVRPPANSDVAFDLTVRVTIADGSVQQSFTGALRVDPVGRADMPTFSVADARGREHHSYDPADGRTPLPISLAVTDTDGSETARAIIRDVPAGFVLSAGRNMGNGVWVLDPGQERGLTVRAPAGYDGTVVLRVDALVSEREGDSRTVSQTLRLAVSDADGNPGSGGGGGGGVGGPGVPAVDAPRLSVRLAPGREDQPLDLTITPDRASGGVGDLVQTFVVEGLPAGASLSAGFLDSSTGRWLLSESELAGLKLIPPANLDGPISVQVSAIVTDSIGQTAATDDRAGADLEAVADAARISATPEAGIEDTPVALNLSVTPTDSDGSEHVASVVISNLPSGARLVGVGISDDGHGNFSVDPAHLASLQVVPPPNAHGNFSLTVTATSVEAANGSSRTSSQSVAFSVAADPDAPVPHATAATGTEDARIPLTLGAVLADTDGSEVMSVVVGGLPAGAILSAGINNGNGSWTLLPGQLAGLSITPPADFSGTINATLTAYAMERSTGGVASTVQPFTIAVAAVADTPIIAAAERVTGLEDGALPVGLAAHLTDTDGSEVLSVVATDVPAGGHFSAGQRNPDGSWSFTTAELPGLAFTPPENFSGELTLRFTAVAAEPNGSEAAAAQDVTFVVRAVADAPLLSAPAARGTEDVPVPLAISAALVDIDGSESLQAVVIAGLPSGFHLSAGTDLGNGSYRVPVASLAGLALVAPANWSGTLALTATATSAEATGGSASTTIPISVTIDAVADAPHLTAPVIRGTEDAPTLLAVSVALADTDGSETLQAVVIAGLPAGFHLSAGADNGDGSYSVPVADLPGLALHAPANWNGALALTATATSAEATGGSASTTIPLSVTIGAVNDAPELSVTPAAGVTAGADHAALVGTVTASDVDGDPVAGATIALGAGRQPDDAVMVQGYTLHAENGHTMIGDTGIEIVGGGFDPATGALVLAGDAPQASYQAVLGAMVLVNTSGAALEAGDRQVSITLRDPAGARDADTVTVVVAPSDIHGTGADATLAGTGAADTFHGSAGNEAMQGSAGNDLFLLAIGGGHDSVDGGAGHDTLALSGVAGAPTAGPPDAGGWQLVLDGTPSAPTHGTNSLDFSEPVTGHIVLGDGTQVDFSGIERITW